MVQRAEGYFEVNDSTFVKKGFVQQSSKVNAGNELTAYFQKLSADSSKKEERVYSPSQPSIDEVPSSKRVLEIAKKWLTDEWNNQVAQVQKELKKKGKNVSKAEAEQELRIRNEMEDKGITREQAKVNVETRQKLVKQKAEAKSNAQKYAHDKHFNPMTSIGVPYRTAVRASYTVAPYFIINGTKYTRSQIEKACKEIENEYNINRNTFHYEARCLKPECGADHAGAIVDPKDLS